MRRLLHWALGWTDRSTIRLAVAMYLSLSITFVVLGVLVVRSDAAAMGPVRLSLFAVLLLVHTVLHWFGLPLVWVRPRSWKRQLAYCAAQAGLVLVISVLHSQPFFTLALWATLLAETAALLWPQWQAVLLSVCVYSGLFLSDMILVSGFPQLANSWPTVAPVLAGPLLAWLVLWALLVAQQFGNREKAEAVVRELRAAQRQLEEYALQVEELTISQERQRMAREMHDTLAQGLAGVILQLEAADSHLESGQPAQARAVVQQAMQRARQTLHEARRAIQALRSVVLEQKDLASVLAGEVSQFEATSGVQAQFVVEGEPGPIAPAVAQDVLRIVQESLSNIGRHAQARHAEVRLLQSGTALRLTVRDDGRGFDAKEAVQRPECYGLQGMHERAQRIGARLSIESAPQAGTTVRLSLEGVPERGLEPDQPRLSGLAEGAATGQEPPP